MLLPNTFLIPFFMQGKGKGAHTGGLSAPSPATLLLPTHFGQSYARNLRTLVLVCTPILGAETRPTLVI